MWLATHRLRGIDVTLRTMPIQGYFCISADSEYIIVPSEAFVTQMECDATRAQCTAHQRASQFLFSCLFCFGECPLSEHFPMHTPGERDFARLSAYFIRSNFHSINILLLSFVYDYVTDGWRCGPLKTKSDYIYSIHLLRRHIVCACSMQSKTVESLRKWCFRNDYYWESMWSTVIGLGNQMCVCDACTKTFRSTPPSQNSEVEGLS